MTPRVSIVTVNYKTVDHLERMLASLFFRVQIPVEVWVVENHSGDDLSTLQKQYPQVRFLFPDRNLGFAGGCNLALRQATGTYHVLVNPDIIFDEDAISGLVSLLDQDSKIGIAGCLLRNLDGTPQPSLARFPTPWDQLLLLFKLPHLFPHLQALDHWLMRDTPLDRALDVDQVKGAFFAFRRELFDALQGFDERFFLWYEEVDFCKRAVDAGWRVRFDPSFAVRHRGAGSFDRVATFRKQAMIRRSLRWYMRKHYGRAVWLLFWMLNPLFVGLAVLAALIKPR